MAYGLAASSLPTRAYTERGGQTRRARVPIDSRIYPSKSPVRSPECTEDNVPAAGYACPPCRIALEYTAP